MSADAPKRISLAGAQHKILVVYHEGLTAANVASESASKTSAKFAQVCSFTRLNFEYFE